MTNKEVAQALFVSPKTVERPSRGLREAGHPSLASRRSHGRAPAGHRRLRSSARPSVAVSGNRRAVPGDRLGLRAVRAVRAAGAIRVRAGRHGGAGEQPARRVDCAGEGVPPHSPRRAPGRRAAGRRAHEQVGRSDPVPEPKTVEATLSRVYGKSRSSPGRNSAPGGQVGLRAPKRRTSPLIEGAAASYVRWREPDVSRRELLTGRVGGHLEAAGKRVCAEVEALARAGRRVRMLRTTIVPVTSAALHPRRVVGRSSCAKLHSRRRGLRTDSRPR